MKITQLATKLIHPCPTNPRGKDLGDLTELALSLRNNGLLQPITVRKHPKKKDHFEIVFGHRRHGAAKKAGIKELDCLLVAVDDRQVLEQQLVENCQRKDVNAIDQAEGYRRLMDDHGLSADQVADRVARSRSWIYGRLKLLEIDKAVLKAAREEAMSDSCLLLIARMTPELQERALCLWERFPTYRDFKNAIEDELLIPLSKAIFKTTDNDLVPDADGCGLCSKRSGNAPELWGDIKGKSVCTDRDCFDKKQAAGWKAIVRTTKGAGGKANKGYSKPYDNVALDEPCHALKAKPAEGKTNPTWRQLLKKHKIENVPTDRTLCEGKSVTESVDEYRASLALRKAGLKVTVRSKPVAPAMSTGAARTPEEQAKRKRDQAVEEAFRDAEVRAVNAAIDKMPAKDDILLREAAAAIEDLNGYWSAAQALGMGKDEKPVVTTGIEALRWLALCNVAEQIAYNSSDYYDTFGLDKKALKAEAELVVAEAEKAKLVEEATKS